MMERGWVKFLLFGGVSLVVFVMGVWLTLPDDELGEIARARIENALGNRYDVTFGSFSISGVSAIEIEDLNIKTRPPGLDASDEEREAFKKNYADTTVDRVLIDFEVIASAMARSPVVDFEVELGGGSMEGTYAQVPYEPKTKAGARGKARGKKGKKKDKEEEPAPEEEGEAQVLMGHRVEMTFEALSLGSLDVLQSSLGGLPIKGQINGTASVFLDQSGQRLQGGAMDLSAKAVTLGPGPLPFDTGFGKFEVKLTTLGDLTLKADVEENKLQIRDVSTTGPDVVFEAAGYLSLANQLATSSARITARVKPSKGFLERNDLQGILDVDPKVRRAKSGEYYGFIVNGPVSRLKPIPNKRAAGGIEKPAKKK